MKKQKNFNERGITLVALVITIIILLILAGISIAQLTGSGLFENARLAEQKSKEAQEKEEGILADYENKINSYLDGTRTNEKTEIDIESIKTQIKSELKAELENELKQTIQDEVEKVTPTNFSVEKDLLLNREITSGSYTLDGTVSYYDLFVFIGYSYDSYSARVIPKELLNTRTRIGLDDSADMCMDVTLNSSNNTVVINDCWEYNLKYIYGIKFQ